MFWYRAFRSMGTMLMGYMAIFLPSAEEACWLIKNMCTEVERKCPACGNAHAITDLGCLEYRREKANLITLHCECKRKSNNSSAPPLDSPEANPNPARHGRPLL
ncbi:hypothetical protein B0J11DRAFT_512738 [Dendryphion nanum]|uniref:Uncharacterized protein n=1 Tax=Dendryphion nanum TaxID=256645 RepID=A0A9P9I7W8_9PLEO|nr:hypothetical protein B0J11DRAFT_512738 [Dendryphion nanum]